MINYIQSTNTTIGSSISTAAPMSPRSSRSPRIARTRLSQPIEVIDSDDGLDNADSNNTDKGNNKADIKGDFDHILKQRKNLCDNQEALCELRERWLDETYGKFRKGKVRFEMMNGVVIDNADLKIALEQEEGEKAAKAIEIRRGLGSVEGLDPSREQKECEKAVAASELPSYEDTQCADTHM